MQLRDLIQTNNWLSVSMTLTMLYPDQSESLPAYIKVYNILLQMEPADSETEIVLLQCYDDETNEESYVDVSGIKKTIKICSYQKVWLLNLYRG